MWCKTIALSFEWTNPLSYCPLCHRMNNTLTTWRFLIKAPQLGKFSVMCDTENNLSSDEKQNCNSS